MIENLRALAIENLNALVIFAAVVDRGGIKSAALDLGLKPSEVRDRLSKLESKLGLSLLHSTSIKLSLTHEGETLYKAAKAGLNIVIDGLDEVIGNSQELIGDLKITMPSTFSGSLFLAKIGKFKQNYPKVRIDIQFTDLHQNIVGEGVDLAIRISTFPEGRLMVKKVDVLQPIVLASPAYIKRRGVELSSLKHPNDIANWDFIGIAHRPMRKIFIDQNGDDLRLEFKPNIVVDNMQAAQYLACQGLGIASPPAFLFGDKLKTGELVALLPYWKMKEVPVNAVWPPNSKKDKLIKRLIEFLNK